MSRRISTHLLISFFPAIITIASNAQQGDCPGEIICTTQNDVMSASTVNEINVTNCGCLPPSETAMSYWYQICVSTPGTIAFAINPTGSGSDYNLAVWGPGSTCPPSAMPLRCSSAIPPVGGNNADKIGLGQGATDFSENGSGDGWVAPINAAVGECYVLSVNKVSGTNDFNIQFDGSATVTCNPLPVTLTSFSCNTISDGIQLSWNCQSETNNSHFIIERTDDGVNYEFIARIEGAGTTSQPTSYMYTDLTAPEGTNYYRLTQVDYNGTETAYGPIACEFVSNGPAIIEIISMSGQVIYTSETANYQQIIREQNLAAGIYLIAITRGNSRQSFKYAVADHVVK